MKLEGMFKDIDTSTGLIEEYKKTQEYASYLNFDRDSFQAASSIDFSVLVLTTGNWPFNEIPACNIPLNILNTFDAFRNFYLKKHNGRKLDLAISHGSVELNANFYGQSSGDVSQQVVFCCRKF